MSSTGAMKTASQDQECPSADWGSQSWEQHLLVQREPYIMILGSFCIGNMVQLRSDPSSHNRSSAEMKLKNLGSAFPFLFSLLFKDVWGIMTYYERGVESYCMHLYFLDHILKSNLTPHPPPTPRANLLILRPHFYRQEKCRFLWMASKNQNKTKHYTVNRSAKLS